MHSFRYPAVDRRVKIVPPAAAPSPGSAPTCSKGGTSALRPLAPPRIRTHRRSEPNHVAVRIDEHALVLAPLGVLREPHIASGRKPSLGQCVGILDEQVGGRPPVYSRIEVRLHAEMNLRAIKGDEAVPAAVPVADIETKPAVVGKGSNQAANWKDRRYSRTHECNLPPGAARCRPAAGRSAVAAMLDDARGWRLAEMRKRRGMTQEQVAVRMGVSVARVSQIESGDVSTQDVLSRFVAALGGTLKLIADFGDEQLKLA